MSEQEEAFPRVWDAFLAADALIDGRHDSPKWRAHPGPFALSMIRVPASQLLPGLAECRAAVAQLPDLRLHPDGFLHIALQEIGFVTAQPLHADEISPSSLEEFVAMAAPAISERPPFTVSLRGLNSFQDAVFVEVHDAGETAWLHQRLFEISATADDATYAYLPHMTIAHYTGAGDPAAAATAIAPWRHLHLAELTVTEVEISTLATNEPYPEFQQYAVFPLLG